MGHDDDLSIAGTNHTSNGESVEDQDPAPAPKRRRVGLACSACRIRKSRCNGVRPRCEPCERLGFECIYELPDTSANLLVPRDLFTALEEKVRILEVTVKHQGQRLTEVEACRPNGADPGRPATQLPILPSNVVVNVEGIQDQTTDQSMTDGMALSFVDDQDCGFFGPSSNIAFMRQIFRAMAKQSAAAGDSVSPSSSNGIGLYQTGMINVSRPLSSSSAKGRAGETSSAVETNVLPPDHETRKLIHSYFSNTGLLFPFIHQESFLETYEHMRQQNFRINVRRTWLGLLNMILAMAICTGWAEDGTEYQNEQSDVYYRRATELCKTQMLRGTTLETVQYLLLMSQYLQSTQKSVQTWTTHGLAVKAALSIGLHSRDAMSKFPPIEQEMRKRTWFGCVLLDRSLSMTFGRPGAIPEDYVKLDLPIPLLPCDGVITTHNDTSIAFFNATILLYRVMWKVIATLYGHNLGCDDPPSETLMITQIFNLEQELSDWHNSLPSPLFLRSSTNLPEECLLEDRPMERFRLILSLRYLSVQLLLHRPMLTNSLGGCARYPTSLRRNQRSVNQMQTNFNRTCVRAAEDIIEIIHTILTKPGLGRHLFGAWWFTLYYTFNAALVIFGSLLVPMEDIVNDPIDVNRLDRVRQFLEKAADALVQLGTQNGILSRCVDYIKRLSALVENWGTSHSPRTLELPSSGIQFTPQYNSVDVPHENMDIQPELLMGMPMQEGTITSFQDELELGTFFSNEIQQWFKRFPI
ncbi:fungal-specific transcription factor domain-containing protein [Ilyonectria robusta]|uniref:fungal-specific transcription factor domain-containing protein n=1 Tax=Ilyonectria robusta TaxID=1079257 RepID=UPI001E8DEDA3|nr:fungal-specific transcription factor domain-containing protein [Ilyonectria robusta]KAH8738453.1 fungal-specific transcription factor domain-containing protein [Ilyonectria robusta]